MPATHTITADLIDRPNLALKSVKLVSTTARTRDTANRLKISVRLQKGGKTDEIASYDQSVTGLPAGEPREILQAKRRGQRLPEDRLVVIQVIVNGSPATLYGMALHFRYELVGGASGDIKPLLTASGGPGVELLISQMMSSGITERTKTVQLSDGQ